MREPSPGRGRLLALTIAWLLLAAAAITVGAVGLELTDVPRCLVGALGAEPTDVACTVLVALRVPRVLLASGVGASLAIAGVLLQAVLRSTLADPYTLGVSSGAMFGAASASALAVAVPALAGVGLVALPVGATIGGLGAAALAVALARVGGDVAPGRLLLVGAALSSLSASLTGLLLAVAPEAARVRSLVLWLLGGLHAPSWSGVAWTAGAAIGGGLVAWRLSRALDVLLLGEVEARALGLDVDRVRGGLVLLAAALTGVAVAYSGAIGFVGLAVPHVARRWLGAAHGALVVGAALLGAASLVALDAVARTVVAPEELPVGVLAGALGAPFFLLVLRGDPRHGRGGLHDG